MEILHLGLYHLCRENKGADQLRSYCEADLRLCFRIYKKAVFSYEAHIRLNRFLTKLLISSC